MSKKLEELHKEDSETAKEHFDEIKQKVEDGSYFSDALDWYFFRYVTTICDRTILIFGGIVAAIIFYFLLQMIQGAFPLVVQEPIFTRAKDQAQYFPSLVHLKPKEGEAGYDPNVKTVDEAVLKYMVEKYVRDREEYDFSAAEIQDVNIKFSRIKNSSSEMEYRKFQLFMSKDNLSSPINDFGLPVRRSVKIDSIKFVSREASHFASRALYYITGKIPTEADVRFTVTKTSIGENEELQTETQPYFVKMNFTFDGISKPDKNKLNIIKFTVNNYELSKIKTVN
jgi:type IV secretory pathway component VirB8